MSMNYKTKLDAYLRVGEYIKKENNVEFREFVQDFLKREKDYESFRVEKANGDREITLPESFKMVNIVKLMKEEDERLNKIDQKEANNMKVSLNFRNAVKDYSVLVMLKNSDLTDVRVYELNITVLPRVFKAILEFQTPASMELRQEIPVTNATYQDLNFEIERKDDLNGHYFRFPASLVVPGESTQHLPVIFKPEWIKKSLTTITITNPSTREKFQYQLKGRGLEPLAEDHIKFKCDVGSNKTHVIEIPNKKAQDVTYTVKFDMHGVTGEDTFVVKSGKTYQYVLQVNPTLGGIYAGCVTFTDLDTQRYLWYSMELESKGQRNIKEYEISSIVRKESYLEIPISNPYNESLEYHVKIRGNNLTGSTSFSIAPRTTEMYNLRYLPLSVHDEEGTVSFTNSKAGELFCKIRMTSSEAKMQKLPLMIGEIGKFVFQEVTLENPSSMSTWVDSYLSNDENFEVEPARFEIGPYSNTKVKIKYIPNELDVQNNGEVNFKSEKIGNWKFLVFGRGEIPTDYEERKMTALLKKEGSTVITFTNPFKVNIIVQLSLERETKEDEEAFELLQKKSKISLHPGAKVQIPISFYPSEISEYKCKLVIKLNEKIEWVYPIRVVTEATIPPKELVI